MKVRDYSVPHVISPFLFFIIAIIPLIIVMRSSTENISVSTVFLFKLLLFHIPFHLAA